MKRYYRQPDIVTIEELNNGLYLVHTETTEFTIDKETLEKEYLAI